MLAVQSDIWFEFLTNLKGTVRVISSEPPCKDANVRFTTGTHEVLAEGPGFAREKNSAQLVKPFDRLYRIHNIYMNV